MHIFCHFSTVIKYKFIPHVCICVEDGLCCYYTLALLRYNLHTHGTNILLNHISCHYMGFRMTYTEYGIV